MINTDNLLWIAAVSRPRKHLLLKSGSDQENIVINQQCGQCHKQKYMH